MEQGSGEELEHLKELVQHHEVCWDLTRLNSATTAGETLHVGYEVVVTGVFNDPSRPSATIRVKTDEVLGALHELAVDLREHAGLPAEHRIKSYGDGIQATSRRDRNEARVKLALLHATGFHVPADEKLEHSLHLLESRLKLLGACKGTWRTA